MTSGDPVAVVAFRVLTSEWKRHRISDGSRRIGGKRLELIGELLGHFSRVVVLSNPRNPYCIVAVESARRAAAALRVQLDVVEIAKAPDLVDAFLKVRSIRPDAILVIADPLLANLQPQIAEFLLQTRLPSIYTYREQVLAGGLVSPDHGCDGQTVSPSPQSNSQTSAGIPYSWLLTLVAHFRASFRRPYAVQLRRCRLDARFVTASLNQDGQSDPCQLVGERDYQNIAM